MSSQPTNITAGRGQPGQVPAWLADDYLETYLRWREACAAARESYEKWNTAGRQTRAAAFAAYWAALDREEHAARIHCQRVERARRWLAASGMPTASSIQKGPT